MDSRTSIWKSQEQGFREAEDWVAVEEPLEIRVNGGNLAVVMRTPGHDLELAAGFALTEGIVPSASGIGTLRACPSGEGGAGNIVEIGLTEGVTFDRERLRRNLMTSAACGLCGKASLHALVVQAVFHADVIEQNHRGMADGAGSRSRELTGPAKR